MEVKVYFIAPGLYHRTRDCPSLRTLQEQVREETWDKEPGSLERCSMCWPPEADELWRL